MYIYGYNIDVYDMEKIIIVELLLLLESVNSFKVLFGQKTTQKATDGLKHGELNSKRRETILRENNIFDILKKFESLTQSEKMPPYSFICWKLVPSLKNSQSGIFRLFAATYRNRN